MSSVHPSAVVQPGAVIGKGAEIGAGAFVGARVRIGADTKVMPHAVIDGNTSVGSRCVIYPGACLGFPPQDKKFSGDSSFVQIGDDNIFREHVTVHGATKEGGKTVVGDRNYLMVGVHVGHDCVLGSDLTIANAVALGGFVEVEDRAVIGGCAAVHQFVRIGRLSMIGGVSKVVMDVPPFSISDGNPARFRGSNSIGLRRAGYSSKDSAAIRGALKKLFASGLNLSNAVAQVRAEYSGNADVEGILRFIERSKRGVGRSIGEES